MNPYEIGGKPILHLTSRTDKLTDEQFIKGVTLTLGDPLDGKGVTIKEQTPEQQIMERDIREAAVAVDVKMSKVSREGKAKAAESNRPGESLAQRLFREHAIEVMNAPDPATVPVPKRRKTRRTR